IEKVARGRRQESERIAFREVRIGGDRFTRRYIRRQRVVALRFESRGKRFALARRRAEVAVRKWRVGGRHCEALEAFRFQYFPVDARGAWIGGFERLPREVVVTFAEAGLVEPHARREQ